MTKGNAVEIVENFWRDVWQARDPEAIDRYVTEDFTLTSGGIDIRSRSEFKKWARTFLSKIDDFEFYIVETFQNDKGDRVASRWRITGKNNGFANTTPCHSPIEVTGTAIWEVRDDGRLAHNWVERNAYEVFRELEKK
nr:hypothetical protein [uncultured bacterium]